MDAVDSPGTVPVREQPQCQTARRRSAHLLGLHIALPGTRLALWFGALILLFAGMLVTRAMRDLEPADRP